MRRHALHPEAQSTHRNHMRRWLELGAPLALIALLGWATWPPRDTVGLGWYALLVLGAAGVVLDVLLHAEAGSRPAPILTGLVLTLVALLLVYAAIPWEGGTPIPGVADSLGDDRHSGR